MRNSTKKITAIAAALLLSVSTVATTATMAAPVFAIGFQEEEAQYDLTAAAVENDDSAVYTASIATADKTKVYTTATAGDENAFVAGTYYYTGSAITPFDDKTIYVQLTVEDDTSPTPNTATVRVKADVSKIEYSNNIAVGSNTATAKVYFTAKDTVAVNEKEVKVTGTGYVVVTFSITATSLDGAFIKTPVQTTWTGGKISIPKSDLALYAKDADGNVVAVDESLYKISTISAGTDLKEENGYVTFNYTAAPGNINVTYALTTEGAKNYSLTSATVNNAIVVNKAKWSDVAIVAENTTKATTANVTVTLNGNKLTSTTNYVASATAENGLSKVTVKGLLTYFEDANPSDESYTSVETYYVDVCESIVPMIKSVKLTDTKTTSYTYTGEEIKPDVTVTLTNNATLTEGVDYEIVYESNTKVGEATFYVQGIGAYAGTKTGGTFTITPKKLSETTVETTDVTYETTLPTVAELAKGLTVKNGDVELVYGTDYTISVNGGVKEGANNVKILPVTKDAEGNAVTPNFTGSTTATVNVVKVADISTAEIATIANVAYTGEAQTPALKVTLGDKELVAGTDYTVEYTNNTEVGCATATITGIGAYTGTNERNFVIVPQQVTGLKAIKKTATTLKLQFNAVEGADGYKIYDAETGKAIASVSTQNGATVLKKTITGLNAGETRKYKVRAYKIVNGTKRYAEYSAVYTKATAKK